jgi:hypothetical protein
MKKIGQEAETANNYDSVPPPPPPPVDVAILNADILRKEQALKPLMAIQQKMVDRLKQTRHLYSEQQKNLRVLQSSKAKPTASLETKLLKVLKGIVVKQSSNYSGSLNGKDIKKVINNAIYLFGEFLSILKLGKHDNCELNDDAIDALCQHFQSVFCL